jgi:hypothetical protein
MRIGYGKIVTKINLVIQSKYRQKKAINSEGRRSGGGKQAK